jgi:hypothetical protein
MLVFNFETLYLHKFYIMKKIILLSIFILSSILSFSQNKTANSLTYKTSVGLRLGAGGGLNLKTFIDEKKAVEFIGFFSSKVTRIVALYEIHGDLNTESNLKWYFGFGPNIGFYKNVSQAAIGITGAVGLDYKFKNLPLNLAIDWQPSFQSGGNGFLGDWITLGVRYTL